MAATIRLSQPHSSSFNHLVDDGEYSRRHLYVQRSRRLQVYDELEFGRLQYRQFGWLLTLEDSAGIVTDLTTRLREVGSVAHQPAGFDKLTLSTSRRNPVAPTSGWQIARGDRQRNCPQRGRGHRDARAQSRQRPH